MIAGMKQRWTRDTEGAAGRQLYGSGNNHFVSRNGNSR